MCLLKQFHGLACQFTAHFKNIETTQRFRARTAEEQAICCHAVSTGHAYRSAIVEVAVDRKGQLLRSAVFAHTVNGHAVNIQAGISVAPEARIECKTFPWKPMQLRVVVSPLVFFGAKMLRNGQQPSLRHWHLIQPKIVVGMRYQGLHVLQPFCFNWKRTVGCALSKAKLGVFEPCCFVGRQINGGPEVDSRLVKFKPRMVIARFVVMPSSRFFCFQNPKFSCDFEVLNGFVQTL